MRPETSRKFFNSLLGEVIIWNSQSVYVHCARNAQLSQRDLAERVGVDFTYLSKIENGRVEPHSEAVLKNVSRELAEALAGGSVIKGRHVTFSGIPSSGMSAFPKGGFRHTARFWGRGSRPARYAVGP